MTFPICHFCGISGARMNGPHWTGTEYVRVDFHVDCGDQIVKAPKAPRQPRRKRTGPIPGSDLWYIAKINRT